MKRLALEGKRFGRLIVISYSHSHIQPSKQKRAMWNVLCDCGVKKIVSTANLTAKNVTSCGCYGKEIIKNGTNKKLPGEANFNYKYLSYKSRSKNHKKRLEFKLTKEEFRNIIIKKCYYCEALPSMAHVHRSYNGEFISNGIDRIDSNIGYILENCVPCCFRCNKMKNDMSTYEFIEHLKRILNNVSTKER